MISGSAGNSPSALAMLMDGETATMPPASTSSVTWWIVHTVLVHAARREILGRGGAGAEAVGQVGGMEVVDAKGRPLDDRRVDDLAEHAADDRVGLPVVEQTAEAAGLDLAGEDGCAASDGRLDDSRLDGDGLVPPNVLPHALLEADACLRVHGIVSDQPDELRPPGEAPGIRLDGFDRRVPELIAGEQHDPQPAGLGARHLLGRRHNQLGAAPLKWRSLARVAASA